MLYTSEGLTFGLRPSALGLRSYAFYSSSIDCQRETQSFCQKRYYAASTSFVCTPVRIVLQRVSQANVSVDGQSVGSIGQGYTLLIGVLQGDTEQQVKAMAQKISSIRLFEGQDGKINDRSILDVQGSILAVSQFTLAGKVEKGNRPDYTAAMEPAEAKLLYNLFVDELRKQNIPVQTGVFGAAMQVSLVNEGPVTLVLDR